MEKIEQALAFIDASERGVWIAMGMSIKHELGDAGFDLWDEWSRTATNYSQQAARASWRSFRGHGVTIGSLYHEARANGWRDTSGPPDAAQIAERNRLAADRASAEGRALAQAQEAAAKKAAWIMHQCKPEQHAYLHSKGWQAMQGMVWRPDLTTNLLCIPMRINDSLVGLQLIDRLGAKKYLKGQRTSRAEYVISNLGRGCSEWFVEGYATGLSLRECLSALKMRYRIHITFSAGNLTKLAQAYGEGFIVADNDESGTGERAAIDAGLPYYMPPNGDLNDLHKSAGLFRASQELRRWISAQ